MLPWGLFKSNFTHVLQKMQAHMSSSPYAYGCLMVPLSLLQIGVVPMVGGALSVVQNGAKGRGAWLSWTIRVPKADQS